MVRNLNDVTLEISAVSVRHNVGTFISDISEISNCLSRYSDSRYHSTIVKEIQLCRIKILLSINDLYASVSDIERHACVDYILWYSAESAREISEVVIHIIVRIVAIISIAAGRCIAVHSFKLYLT